MYSIFRQRTQSKDMWNHILQLQPESNVKYLFKAALKLKMNDWIIKLNWVETKKNITKNTSSKERFFLANVSTPGPV